MRPPKRASVRVIATAVAFGGLLAGFLVASSALTARSVVPPAAEGVIDRRPAVVRVERPLGAFDPFATTLVTVVAFGALGSQIVRRAGSGRALLVAGALAGLTVGLIAAPFELLSQLPFDRAVDQVNHGPKAEVTGSVAFLQIEILVVAWAVVGSLLTLGSGLVWRWRGAERAARASSPQ